MIKSTRITTLALTISLLGGCATSQPAMSGQNTEFGQAVRHNIAVHAIAPTKKQKANTYIPADSVKRAKARKNYQTGETPAPEPIVTNN